MRKDIVIELSYKGFSRASDYSKPSQSPLKPNQDAATLLVRNHARNGDKRTRITKQGVKD